jgi:NhaP-type Na+/H+ and K+/H+ antiporter
MALLFTFVLFGTSLIWTGLQFFTIAGVAFALLAIFIRPVAFMLSLLGTRLNRSDRLTISWFGPRALSTLLLVLVPVFAGVREGDRLFAICSLVVLASVVIHGGSILALPRRDAPRSISSPSDTGQPRADTEMDAGGREQIEPVTITMQPPRRPDVPAKDGDGVVSEERAGVTPQSGETITIAEYKRLKESGQPVVVVDARTERTRDRNDYDAEGAVRVDPWFATRDIKQLGIPKSAWLVIFCA